MWGNFESPTSNSGIFVEIAEIVVKVEIVNILYQMQ
jgi:hypothetical protein